MQVKIPFQYRWRHPLKNDIKTATTRTKPAGVVGDTFDAFGCDFVLTAILPMTLHQVATLHYPEEGCYSPEDFKIVWKDLHPWQGFEAGRQVYLHRFRRTSSDS